MKPASATAWLEGAGRADCQRGAACPGEQPGADTEDY